MMAKSESKTGKLKQALRNNLRKRKVQSKKLLSDGDHSLKLRSRQLSAETPSQKSGRSDGETDGGSGSSD